MYRKSKEEITKYKYYTEILSSLKKKHYRVPSISEVVEATGRPEYVVINDLRGLRLLKQVCRVNQVLKRIELGLPAPKESSEPIYITSNDKEYKPSIEKREPLYRKYFLDLPEDERPTLTELCKLLGKSKGIVAKDIRYFECKYGKKYPIQDITPIENKELGYFEVNKLLEEVCSDAYFERVDKYLSYIQKEGYIPTKTELSREFGIDKNIIAEDLSRLGLKCMTQNEILEVFRKPVEQRALEREGFYREHYFESDCPLTMDEMADILDEFKQVVHRDIQYLNQKYKVNPRVIQEKRKEYVDMCNLSYYRSIFEAYFKEKGYIPLETTVSNDLGLSRSIVHFVFKEFSYESSTPFQSIVLEKHREPFYQEHYFNSSAPMSYAKMAKILNIHPNTVLRNIAELKDKYACSEIDDKCEAYQKLKGDLDYDERYKIRQGIYKSMMKYNKHYRISDLCCLFSCHYDVIALDKKKSTILDSIIIK